MPHDIVLKEVRQVSEDFSSRYSSLYKQYLYLIQNTENKNPLLNRFTYVPKGVLDGERIQEALEVSKSVTKNYVMLSIIETAINNTITGESWVQPFEESGLTNSMITEMLKIGMQTDLATMVEKIVEYLDMDINVVIERIVKVLPQILYAIVGVLIILVTIVVLVPCITAYMGNYLWSAAGM